MKKLLSLLLLGLGLSAQAGVPYIANVNGTGSHITVSNLVIFPVGIPYGIYFTNSGVLSGDANEPLIIFQNSHTNTIRLAFSDIVSNRNCYMQWNPVHSQNKGEMIFSANQGSSLALGFTWIQHGITFNPVTYEYYQYSTTPYPGGITNLGGSVPLIWKALVYTNGATPCFAGSLNDFQDGTVLPGMNFVATSTNGSGAWIWYSALGITNDATAQNINVDSAKSHEAFRMTVGPDAGFSFSGNLIANGVPALTTTFLAADGFFMTYQNGLLTARNPLDTTVSNYLGRITLDTSVTNATSITNALQGFVTALKADGTWTNFDAIYPFIGTNATANSNNLISTSYPITWNRTAFATNNGSGIHGNGDGWGDTHWVPSGTNATLCTFIKYKQSGSTNTAFYLGGDDGGGVSCLQWHNATLVNVSRSVNGNNGAIGALSDGQVLCNIRNGTTITDFKDGTKIVNTATSPGVLTANTVGILGHNNQGSSDGWGNGKIQFVALGSQALTDGQYATLRAAILALNNALGR